MSSYSVSWIFKGPVLMNELGSDGMNQLFRLIDNDLKKNGIPLPEEMLFNTNENQVTLSWPELFNDNQAIALEEQIIKMFQTSYMFKEVILPHVQTLYREFNGERLEFTIYLPLQTSKDLKLRLQERIDEIEVSEISHTTRGEIAQLEYFKSLLLKGYKPADFVNVISARPNGILYKLNQSLSNIRKEENLQSSIEDWSDRLKQQYSYILGKRQSCEYVLALLSLYKQDFIHEYESEGLTHSRQLSHKEKKINIYYPLAIGFIGGTLSSIFANLLSLHYLPESQFKLFGKNDE